MFPATTAANKPSESVMIPMALMVAIGARGWGVGGVNRWKRRINHMVHTKCALVKKL